MRKSIFLYVAAVAIGCIMYTSCNKVSDLIKAASISWTGSDVTITVPVIADTTQNQDAGSGSFTYNMDSLIKAQTGNQLGLSNIDQFYITSCTMTIQNPDADNNFGNFESASASFATNANTTTANMGSVSNNPGDYATTLSVPVNSSVNLKDYVSPSGTTTFNYSVTGKLRKPTTHELTVIVHVEYSIHVTP